MTPWYSDVHRSMFGELRFRLGPDAKLAVGCDFDVDQIRATADGTILDVVLRSPLREIDRHDNLLATGIANVGGIIVHAESVTKSCLIDPQAGSLRHVKSPSRRPADAW